MDRLQKQIHFIAEIDKLKNVLRQSVLINGQRRENTAEHSWHLAMMAMVLPEYVKEAEVDVLKVIKLVLIHDIVEIDAGDTFAYDEEGYEDKPIREREAADRIFGLLPEDQAEKMWQLWLEFEEKVTPEARFAASIDRLAPLLLNYYTEGYTWKLPGVTLDKIYKRLAIIKESTPEIWEFVEDILEDSIKKGYLKGNE